MVRVFFFPLLILTAAGLLAGCGGAADRAAEDDGMVELTMLTMQLSPTFDDYITGVISDFEAQNPGVSVRWIDQPGDEYETKLMTSFMSGDAPDIINLPAGSVSRYVEMGNIQPLEPYLTEEELSIYVQDLLESSSIIEGQVYALPWYAATNVTFLNTNIVEEAGLSIDEVSPYAEDLPEFARTVHEKTGEFGVFPLYLEEATITEYWKTRGLPVFNEDRTAAAFNTPEHAEVLRFWTDLYREGIVPQEALFATHRRPLELYKSGKLAMIQTGPQFLNQIEADSPDVYEATVVRPDIRWKDYGKSLIKLHTFVLSSRTDHPELAAALAHFMTNAENQLAFAKLVTIIPSTHESLEDPFFTDPEDTLEGMSRKYGAEQTAQGFVFNPPQDSRRLFRVLENITEQVALGKMEAGEALAQAEAEWNEILQE